MRRDECFRVPRNVALPFVLYSKAKFRPLGGPYAGSLGPRYDPVWTSFAAPGTRPVPNPTAKPDELDPYGGIRVAVHHSQADAQSDLKEWITDELEEEFDTLDEAVEAYTERTGKRVIMEEQYA